MLYSTLKNNKKEIMRDYKKLIKYAEENPPCSIVVCRDELIQLRKKYDIKYTLKNNKLQNIDVFNGNGLLNGIELSWGEWTQ